MVLTIYLCRARKRTKSLHERSEVAMTDNPTSVIDDYLTQVLAVLQRCAGICALPDDAAQLKAMVRDVVRDAETLTIVLQAGALNLDQRLLLREALLQELRTETAHIDVQFRRLDPTEVPLPQSSSTTQALALTRKPRAIAQVARVIAVASGKGGVGKSTVSAALALALTRLGTRVGLLDADIYGPSLPTLFGTRGPLQSSADGKLSPIIAHDVQTMSFGYLTAPDTPAIWRGPLISKTFRQLCYQVAWQDVDWLVIDLPPGTGDVQLTMLESLPLHGAVVVTTPQNLALIDMQKAVKMFMKLQINVIGLIENMSSYRCPHCQHEDTPFGAHGGQDYAQRTGLKLLGAVPFRAEILRHCDAGQPQLLVDDLFVNIAQQIASSVDV